MTSEPRTSIVTCKTHIQQNYRRHGPRSTTEVAGPKMTRRQDDGRIESWHQQHASQQKKLRQDGGGADGPRTDAEAAREDTRITAVVFWYHFTGWDRWSAFVRASSQASERIYSCVFLLAQVLEFHINQTLTAQLLKQRLDNACITLDSPLQLQSHYDMGIQVHRHWRSIIRRVDNLAWIPLSLPSVTLCQ